MYEFIKTILSALQIWVDKRIQKTTPDWNQNDSNADGYIKNRPFYTDEDKVIKLDAKYLPDAKTYLDENVFNPDYEIDNKYAVGYIKNRPFYYKEHKAVNKELIITSESENITYIPHELNLENGRYLVKLFLRYQRFGDILEFSYEEELDLVKSSDGYFDLYIEPYGFEQTGSDFTILDIYNSDSASSHAGTIRFFDQYGSTKILPNDFQISFIQLKQLDEHVIPDSIARVDAVKEEVAKTKDYISLTDKNTGYKYLIGICDGKLVSYVGVKSIEVTAMPKTEYMHGEYFNPDGMIVTATCYDGTTKDITDYSYTSKYLTENTECVEIVYMESGVPIITTVPVNVCAFDPSTVLVDFTYIANEDYTYTITGWRGTYNGEASNEIIIPNYGCILV